MRQIVARLLLVLALSAPSWADTLVNWDLGFEVDIPATWLRQEGGTNGLKLASEDVKIDVTPYSGITQSEQIERLHRQSKHDHYEFKTERSYAINQVPAHEMIFYKDGRYLIYYVLMAGQRGLLLTLRSEGTDSDSFKQAQDLINNFRVTSLR